MQERIDFISGDVEVIEAVAFTRNHAANLTKQPHVVLRVKETVLTIEDKSIMWKFLSLLDTTQKFPFLNYLSVIDVVPLKTVIEDFLHDYPNTMFHVWVEKGVIVGFDGGKHNPRATSDTMQEIADYIKTKDNSYDYNICLREQNITWLMQNLRFEKMRVLTAEYISGNKIIEIVSVGQRAQVVYISARYQCGCDFVQPIPSHAYKGALFTMPIKELYEQIDLILDSLKLLDENPMPEIDTHSEAHRMTMVGRNRLEFERGDEWFSAL